MAITTAMCASFKAELAQGLHCFAAQQTPTATLVNGSQALGSLSSTTGLASGMTVTGTGVQSNTSLVVAGGTFSLSLPANASNAGVTLTCSGDLFKVALIKSGMAGTYSSASTNYSNVTGNSDEVTGAGYTAGGFAWTGAQNITPQVSGAGAYWSWSVNPSWTSASFSCAGMMIYNTAYRSGTNNRAVSVHDFGGTQTVASGTFTVILPTNALGTAILQIS
jgi:hypothetical protein